MSYFLINVFQNNSRNVIRKDIKDYTFSGDEMFLAISFPLVKFGIEFRCVYVRPKDFMSHWKYFSVKCQTTQLLLSFSEIPRLH